MLINMMECGTVVTFASIAIKINGTLTLTCEYMLKGMNCMDVSIVAKDFALVHSIDGIKKVVVHYHHLPTRTPQPSK